VVGIIPGITVGGALELASRSVLGAATPEYTLAVWHGFTLPLVMSFVAMVGGVVLYRAMHRYLKLATIDRGPLLSGLDGRSTFEAMLNGIGAVADRVEQLLSTRRLQPQLVLIVLVTLVVAFAPFYDSPIQWGEKSQTEVDPGFALLWLVGVLCT